MAPPKFDGPSPNMIAWQVLETIEENRLCPLRMFKFATFGLRRQSISAQMIEAYISRFIQTAQNFGALNIGIWASRSVWR
jgi:hypothetical protein